MIVMVDLDRFHKLNREENKIMCPSESKIFEDIKVYSMILSTSLVCTMCFLAI